MKSITQKLFQPLQQTYTRIALNLLLAPIGGLIITCTGIVFISTLRAQMDTISTALEVYFVIPYAFLLYIYFLFPSGALLSTRTTFTSISSL